MTETDLLQEFYETGNIPALDFLLDWRNHLMKLKIKTGEAKYYDLEIAATDFLISMYG
jgi:hypothetical protein